MKKKVIIVGAGAAGLMAAAAASEKGHEVLVLEKNEKAGKKIYITGKGRCNLTNDCPTEDFFGHVARNHKFLYSAVYGFDQEGVKAFFEQNGCPVKTERGNRVFPVSDHASDVTAALLRCLKKNGVRILYESPVQGILTEEGRDPEKERALSPDGKQEKQEKQGKHGKQETEAAAASSAGKETKSHVRGVRLRNGKTLLADAVIICTGGLSYPSTGSTGDGFLWARELGLDVVPTAPSLVPFETKEQWCKDLQGLALKNVAVRVFPLDNLLPSVSREREAARENSHGTNEADEGKGHSDKGAGEADLSKVFLSKKKRKRAVYEGFGELLFTHFGVSGPIVLTASCFCDFQKNPQGFGMLLDLKPALTGEQVQDRLRREFALSPGRHLPAAVRPLFPARLAETVTELSGLGTARQAASFTEKEICALADLIKNIPLTLRGTRGYQEAIITRGGLSVKEFNPSTMESRKIAGLYAAGEVLDVDAQTGGYNLQIAWSTGHLAGSSI